MELGLIPTYALRASLQSRGNAAHGCGARGSRLRL